MKLAWASDLHLECAKEACVDQLIETMRNANADHFVIAGDINVGEQVALSIQKLEKALENGIDFVLGNHDYYGGSFETQKMRIRSFLRDNKMKSRYLSDWGVIPLTEKTCIIGHDAWADAKAGNFMASPVRLRDEQMITNLSNLSREELYITMQHLGTESVNAMKLKLLEALPMCPHVVAVMHPPPYREASLYDNKPANDDYAPHFVCHEMGQMFSELMIQHPKNTLLVLCGHSHHAANYKPLPNIQVLVPDATYGSPCLQSIIDLK